MSCPTSTWESAINDRPGWHECSQGETRVRALWPRGDPRAHPAAGGWVATFATGCRRCTIWACGRPEGSRRVRISTRRSTMIHVRATLGLLLTICAAAVWYGCEPSPKAPRSKSGNSSVTTDTGDTAMSLTIESTAFRSNEPIPTRFTGDGEDVSPQVSWSGVPAGAAELALILQDPWRQDRLARERRQD